MSFVIGVDIVTIAKMIRMWREHSKRLMDVVFTRSELRLLNVRKDFGGHPRLTVYQARHLARTFAAKEATLKTMRLGIMDRFELHDIEVLGRRKLKIRFKGKLKNYAQSKKLHSLVGTSSYIRDQVIVFVMGEQKHELF